MMYYQKTKYRRFSNLSHMMRSNVSRNQLLSRDLQLNIYGRILNFLKNILEKNVCFTSVCGHKLEELFFLKSGHFFESASSTSQ